MNTCASYFSSGVQSLDKGFESIQKYLNSADGANFKCVTRVAALAYPVLVVGSCVLKMTSSTAFSGTCKLMLRLYPVFLSLRLVDYVGDYRRYPTTKGMLKVVTTTAGISINIFRNLLSNTTDVIFSSLIIAGYVYLIINPDSEEYLKANEHYHIL
jgi:hypothetical protein